MKPYVVKQGDFFAKLAFVHGFDADKVWHHPKNEELSALRKDGDVLFPGDILYVPVAPRKTLAFTKEAVNAYKARLPRVKVKIALAGPGGEPLANEPYVLKGLGDDEPKTADGDGNVIFEAPVNVRQVELSLPSRTQIYRVLVGDLDPVREPSGGRMRLEHLGLCGAAFAEGEEAYARLDEAQLAAALKAFQRRQGPSATGELDAAIEEALLIAHGS